MDQPNAENAHPRRGAAKKLGRLRERLRRSAQRHCNAIEAASCVLGLLIGIGVGIALSREGPVGHTFAEGRASAASLP